MQISGRIWIVMMLVVILNISGAATGWSSEQTINEPVAIFWHNGRELKALTILAMRADGSKAVIGTVPVFAYYASYRGGPGSRGLPQTVGEMFAAQGRAAVLTAVSTYLGLPLSKYVAIEQKAFASMSELVGPTTINGKEITMATAFEQTRLGIRHDDQQVVRAFSAKLRQPEEWWKLPRLAWLLVTAVDTNLTMQELWQYYSLYRQIGPERTYKEAVQGRDFYIDGVKYRAISPREWQEFFPRLLK
ncbi:MAG: LCP family protein [Bacillota bacterium]